MQTYKTSSAHLGYPESQDDSYVLGQIIQVGLISVLVIGLICLINGFLVGEGLLQQIAIPLIFVGIPLLVNHLNKGKVSDLGITLEQWGESVRLLVVTSALIFPLVFGGAWILLKMEIALPLLPVMSQQELPGWILYQFLYIAVSEELFFRGFLQGRLLKLNIWTTKEGEVSWQRLTVVISAMVFALAHMLILGETYAAITFFPGLLFGWLFLKTRSLLTPVIFHGLANTVYALIHIYVVPLV